MLEAWQNFFVAQAGASAALLGLLFVSISLNLTKILSFPTLPNRALLALFLLFSVLILSLLLLIPGQPACVLALEVLAAGALLSSAGLAIAVKAYRQSRARGLTFAANTVLSLFAAVPYVAAGCLLLAHDGHALGWVAAGMIISFVKAGIDAWVLLVEINR
jgi:hypothetical protein